MGGQVELGPGGLEINNGDTGGGGVHGLSRFQRGTGDSLRVDRTKRLESHTLFYLIDGQSWQCNWSHYGIVRRNEGDGFFGGGEDAFELGVFNGVEHFVEAGRAGSRRR